MYSIAISLKVCPIYIKAPSGNGRHPRWKLYNYLMILHNPSTTSKEIRRRSIAVDSVSGGGGQWPDHQITQPCWPELATKSGRIPLDSEYTRKSYGIWHSGSREIIANSHVRPQPLSPSSSMSNHRCSRAGGWDPLIVWSTFTSWHNPYAYVRTVDVLGDHYLKLMSALRSIHLVCRSTDEIFNIDITGLCVPITCIEKLHKKPGALWNHACVCIFNHRSHCETF